MPRSPTAATTPGQEHDLTGFTETLQNILQIISREMASLFFLAVKIVVENTDQLNKRSQKS